MIDAKNEITCNAFIRSFLPFFFGFVYSVGYLVSFTLPLILNLASSKNVVLENKSQNAMVDFKTKLATY